MPRARATTRWRGRASIPTSSYRGRPDGWASWKASPRSKRSSATTRRSPKTRPRSTRCARITSISSTPDSPPPAGSWTRSSCQKKRARHWHFSSRRRANSPAHTSEPSCCRVNHDTAAHPGVRSEEHTSELQSRLHLVCRLLLEKKKTIERNHMILLHRNHKNVHARRRRIHQV